MEQRHLLASLFLFRAPVSQHKMSRLEEARRIAAGFAYTDDDVRKCVIEFIREMSTLGLYRA
jgi:hypothetical protein